MAPPIYMFHIKKARGGQIHVAPLCRLVTLKSMPTFSQLFTTNYMTRQDHCNTSRSSQSSKKIWGVNFKHLTWPNFISNIAYSFTLFCSRNLLVVYSSYPNTFTVILWYYCSFLMRNIWCGGSDQLLAWWRLAAHSTVGTLQCACYRRVWIRFSTIKSDKLYTVVERCCPTYRFLLIK